MTTSGARDALRILVYPHDLGIGGSQLNAIEIAAGVRDLGHEVTVVGRPGALVARIEELGLRFHELPTPVRRPSRRVADALVDLIDAEGIDIIHGYEWPPTLEALWAVRRRPRAVAVSTVMSMAVAPFIPSSVSLLVGTEQIQAAEREFGRRDVTLIEPPVDLAHNDPSQLEGDRALRRSWGIADHELLVVAVTRLAHQLKLEGLLTAIDVCADLAAVHPIRLVLVGDGPARDLVAERAAAANRRAGRDVVLLAGEVSDPRPAYGAADITLGMGGSALRALAYAKPLIVQGELGFWQLCDPTTVDEFLWGGWYGHGPGAEHGADRLRPILHRLLTDAGLCTQLGRFGRELVESRFSLTAAAQVQLDCYRRALAVQPGRIRTAPADVVGGLRYVGYYAAKRYRRWRGVEAADDFNARPISARPTGGSAGPSPVVAADRGDPAPRGDNGG